MYHTLKSPALLAAFSVAMLSVVVPVRAARFQAPSADRVASLNITLLSTMLADQGFGEWGFAALVEVDGRRILFDTGANEDTVARNLKVLGLDLARVPSVILSHNHADHTTGLMPLRGLAGSKSKSLTTLYVGSGIFLPRVAADGRVDDRMANIKREYESTGGRVVEVETPMRLQPGVWLTGRIPRVHPERNWSGLGKVRLPTGDQDDIVIEDMALVFQTNQGLVVLFGCGHAGVINTLEHVRKTIDSANVKAIIGGLHLYNADEAHLSWTASQLKRFGVQQLVGAHCTGVEAVYRIRALAGLTRQTCMVGAVGATYSLDKGINPLRVAK
jgi:7,8-dihydropterin-6-yl-methyl-4-(beta-D-ribofuranosyl)aminobenzene 5'-phosphate synthase